VESLKKPQILTKKLTRITNSTKDKTDATGPNKGSKIDTKEEEV
jgi:hypothetical protein